MALTLDEEQLFIRARQSVNRTAFRQFYEAQKIEPADKDAIAAAALLFRELPLLRDTTLQRIARETLAGCLGHETTASDPFPLSIWLGGAEDTYDGRVFSGTIAQFVERLKQRAREFAPKRQGWVVEPTTNPTGRRTNEATLAMHALFLDCDGTGEWTTLHATLDQLGFCYVAYQSGGWTPTTPKWRVVIPLHQPHDTSNLEGQAAWKTVYNHARVLFGALGELLSVGFDPATETPCCPWFLTEKRAFDDPERQVVWKLGRTLNLTALALAMPEIPEEFVQDGSPTPTTSSVITLDDSKLDHIVIVLSRATANVPTGRRDLYLALPGVLLDRGVQPDDVLDIIEAVSASYPRQHPDKHADNMHNARTTIALHEAEKNGGKQHHTRIATLNTAHPLVAAAVDEVLPNLANKMLADSVEAQLRPPMMPMADGTMAPAATVLASMKAARRGKLTELGREVSTISTRMKKSTKYRMSGLLMECFIDGKPLPHKTTQEADNLLAIVMASLGRNLLQQTLWSDVLDFASASLSLMGVTQSLERVAAAERAFYEGQGKRKRSNMKKTKIADDFKAKQEAFFNKAGSR